ncbi:hypothetical protein D3C81_1926520 [compost metagenome]
MPRNAVYCCAMAASWSANAGLAHMAFSTGVVALAQLNEGAAVALPAMASNAAKTRRRIMVCRSSDCV